MISLIFFSYYETTVSSYEIAVSSYENVSWCGESNSTCTYVPFTLIVLEISPFILRTLAGPMIEVRMSQKIIQSLRHFSHPMRFFFHPMKFLFYPMSFYEMSMGSEKV